MEHDEIRNELERRFPRLTWVSEPRDDGASVCIGAAAILDCNASVMLRVKVKGDQSVDVDLFRFGSVISFRSLQSALDWLDGFQTLLSRNPKP